MSTAQEISSVPRRSEGFFNARAIPFALRVSVILFFSIPAFAQYGGGGTGMGTGTATGTGSPSYGSGKAIGIGVAAAAAGGVGLYLALHHGSSVTGCVQSGNDGLRLADEKNKKTYSLLPGGTDLKPGEKVELRGKKSNEAGAGQSFQATKLVKNLGDCSTP
jgi:hypothetical protein